MSPSDLLPYDATLSTRERHRQRHRAAVACIPVVEAFCGAYGWRLTIKNRKNYWTLTRGGKTLIWIPSRARATWKGNAEEQHHVHDVIQFLELAHTRPLSPLYREAAERYIKEIDK